MHVQVYKKYTLSHQVQIIINDGKHDDGLFLHVHDCATVVPHKQSTRMCILTGKDRFMALKASFLATGLTARVHGNTRRLPKHALKLEEVKNLVTFLNNHAEKNAILLPGRIPGYKRDDL